MGSHLHQALRCLCSNSGWKYAVFWKLKHRARMMLTWEDAYYDSGNNQEKKCPSNFMTNLQIGHYSHDPLGIAVAKMSCHVYCMGEGIVGRVAVTGKHLWISTDIHAIDPGSPFEYDGWQTQFSAGIKTIAVVAVVPHGVLQLGSLDKIAEDLKMVNHIRDVFSELHGFLAAQPSSAVPYCVGSSCQSDVTTATWGSEVHRDYLQHVDRIGDESGKNSGSSTYSSIEKPGHNFSNLSVPGSYQNKMVNMTAKHEGPKNSIPVFGTSGDLHVPLSESVSMEQLNDEGLGAIGDTKCNGQSSGFGNLSESSENRDALSTNNISSKSSLYDIALLAEHSAMEMSYLPSEIDSIVCNDEGEILCVPKLHNTQLHKDHTDATCMPVRFCAGYELYEALGPAFQKQDCHCECDKEQNETVMAVDVPEGMENSSLLIASPASEHLLDAVVANVHKNEGSGSDKSFCKSELLLDPKRISEPCTSDMGSISSAGYSFDRGALNSFSSSVASSLCYSKGFSSTSCSRGSETLERPQEPNKMQKKRARPGESCRPRPRDRQLIQDRIKELRELVPNGSKCSIDSLLERTIKHMVFMQSVTRHVEKLGKCSGSKFMDKEPSFRGSTCHEQGSSWAVEVGSNLKVCPIIVENSNTNGQLLVEMLCDECSHFLEIAEAMRGMGLTVLKGASESYGDKIWMRFVVEGQKSRNMHRMDLLWSLMQLFQPKLKA